ncbi:BID domain-containing T4SS effector, partial [Bartonella tribocorum]
QRQHQQAQQEKTIQPLSNHEIARKVQQDPSVKQSKREIQFLSKIVYGNPFILQPRLEDMHKIPEIGKELAYQIGNYSNSSGSLTGKEIFGIKTAARKEAEEHLPALCTAIRDYADTVQQLRDTIVQNYQTEQQQRHQPLTDLDRKLQKQQSLWQSPKVPEQSTENRHREISETSKKEELTSNSISPRQNIKSNGVVVMVS